MQRAFLLLEQSLSKLSLLLGCITAISMLIIIFSEVIARYIFNHSFGVSDEFSGYLLVGMIFLGLAYVASKDAHIKVKIVTSRFSPRTNNWARAVSMLLLLVFVAILAKESYDFVFVSYVRNVRSNYIWRTPLWIPKSAIPVGFTMFFLSIVFQFVRVIGKLRGGSQ